MKRSREEPLWRLSPDPSSILQLSPLTSANDSYILLVNTMIVLTNSIGDFSHVFLRSEPLLEEGRIMMRAKGDASTTHVSKHPVNHTASPHEQEPLNTSLVHALPELLLSDRAYVLGRLGREARRQFTQVLSAWELHSSHYGILQLLEAIGQASQQHLAQLLMIDRANMVALLDVLEQRGFIQRQADPGDRRRHIVKLTAVGQGELQQIRHAREEVDEAFFAGLDNQEQETLHRLLVKLFLSLTEQPSAKELHLQKEGHL